MSQIFEEYPEDEPDEFLNWRAYQILIKLRLENEREWCVSRQLGCMPEM